MAFGRKTEEDIAEVPLPSVTAEQAVKAVKAGRSKDVDIAAQIIAENADSMGDQPWTEVEDKSLMRKVDWRLVPIVSLIGCYYVPFGS